MSTRRTRVSVAVVTGAWLGWAAPVWAVPAILTHQGVIAVNGERFTGHGAFRFALVNADTEVYLWVNDGSAVVSPNAPTNPVALAVVNGAYNVRLGAATQPNMLAIPLDLFNDNSRVVLRIWFDDLRGGGVHALSPDLSIATAPFAQYATISGQVNIPRTDTGAVVVADNGDVTIARGLSVDANTLYVDDVGSRVGIGSTSFPGSSKFYVEGDANVSGIFRVDSDDDTLVVNGTLNRVGIGTTSPLDKLQVAGTVRSDGLIVNGAVSGTGFTAWDQNASNDLTTSTIFVGDVTGDWNSTVVGNDSHSHTDSTISDDITINNGTLFAPQSGNVGIGTTSPDSKLQIVGGNLEFASDTNTAASILNAHDLNFYKDSDGDNSFAPWFQFRTGSTIANIRVESGDEADIRGDGPFISNGLDFAEAFKVLDGETDLEAGDVVSLAVGQWEYCRRTPGAYDAHLVGVVSDRPGFICGTSFNAEDAIDPALTARRNDASARRDEDAAKALTIEMNEKMESAHRPIALTGRVPCKVDGNYGPIHAGDRLTSSPTPGHAMLQTRSGPSIGVALEDWTEPSKGDVIVLVQPGWFEIPLSSSQGEQTAQPPAEVFSGTTVLGKDGTAWITVPMALDGGSSAIDYQLTAIGQPAALYVAEKVRDGKFRIAGGSEGLEVSWQVRRAQ